MSSLYYLQRYLLICLYRNSKRDIEFILQHNTYLVNSVYESGNTLLQYAVLYKKPKIVKMIVFDFSADQAYRNREGLTALHYACIYGHFYTVRILLSQSYISLDIPCFENNYPLNYALRNGNYPIAKFLITKGANVDILTESDMYILSRIYTRSEFLYISIINSRNTFTQPINKTEVYHKPSKDIIDIIIKSKVDDNDKCPISLETLKIESAVITSCFHVFDKEHLETWFVSNDKCPSCRSSCVILED